MKPIRFAIYTCPNDTFAFHGMLNKKVDWRGLDFDIQLLDIQTLERRVARGSIGCCQDKLSCRALSCQRLRSLSKRLSVGLRGRSITFGIKSEYHSDSFSTTNLVSGDTHDRHSIVQALLPKHDSARSSCILGNYASTQDRKSGLWGLYSRGPIHLAIGGFVLGRGLGKSMGENDTLSSATRWDHRGMAIRP